MPITIFDNRKRQPETRKEPFKGIYRAHRMYTNYVTSEHRFAGIDSIGAVTAQKRARRARTSGIDERRRASSKQG